MCPAWSAAHSTVTTAWPFGGTTPVDGEMVNTPTTSLAAAADASLYEHISNHVMNISMLISSTADEDSSCTTDGHHNGISADMEILWESRRNETKRERETREWEWYVLPYRDRLSNWLNKLLMNTTWQQTYEPRWWPKKNQGCGNYCANMLGMVQSPHGRVWDLSTTSNIEQLANLQCAQTNSAIYSQWDIDKY